ncbi:N-acetyl-gamma-glutamyl-phosphate reductase [Roseiarcus fermentans]|uniref:N-acetyl-gamma-glutamyl-phosphate reductase n=1 Tax=Roseiarcus fermentans TaxID=1473586 RepID=A0A366EL13_9HYPH|nr:N-acetyl-gamma-glutamyl-phosphate reductase [Roseiarcus fermentans]RBP03081.1 N-acetyl-gamma-glutamyl-phosphate reductase [Roseiarcus fermentans]
MAATIFIDGEAGTTGLQIREKLEGRSGIELVSISAEARKDPAAKRKVYEDVDVVILCLPDEAAKEAAKLVDALGDRAPRVIDASSAHRVAPGWTYGFPELAAGQGEAVAKARKVTNPGCHATGAIALLRPLTQAGLLPANARVSIGSVSGYSGGGKSMIEAYESGKAPAFELYALGLEHKHLPEIELYSGLSERPIFVPSVGNFRQGMLVSIPLHLEALPGKPTLADIKAAYDGHYRGQAHFKAFADAGNARIEPESLNGTNDIEIHVFANESRRHAVVVAKFDNLGKGASGAAVQNLMLMLGR